MRLAFLVRGIVIPIASIVALIVLIRPNNLPFPYIAPFVVVFVLLADLASLSSGFLQSCCVTLASLAIGVAGIEAVLEWRLPHDVRSQQQAMFAADPNFGYHVAAPARIRATRTVDGHFSYAVDYTIDDGLRRLTRSNADGPKVRFFGDSFTFGEGLEDAQTLPQQFADLTGANVLNYGYPGYGPGQALRALQLGLYDKDLEGSQLIVLQTGPFHAERTACKLFFTKGFPRFVTIDGKAELQGRCKPTPWQTSGIYSTLLRGYDQRLSHADVETYLNIVNAFTALARSKFHANVLILDMKTEAVDLRGTGTTFQDIETAFKKAGASVIDDTISAQPGEVLTIPYDGHPTAAKNRLLAQKVADVFAHESDMAGDARRGESTFEK